MPLLGRHKSLPGGANSQRQAQQPAAPPVCESPLFGTRRQLPVAPSAAQQQQQQQAQLHQAASSGPARASKQSALAKSPSAPPASAPDASATLGSIPKQITRQQTHYAFSIMDTNSDGLVDLRDLSQMLANLGVPIDETILSHVMASVSKRGDRRISEQEFLAWIGNFIQVSDLHEPAGDLPTTATAPAQQNQQRPSKPVVRAASSSSAGSLVAQSAEARQLISEQMRQRRGSGSGLALMRSLSSSSSSSSAAAGAHELGERQSRESATTATAAAAAAAAADQARKEQTLAEQQQEARDDLKAAFCVFDLDGDGFITIDEVQQGLKLLGESWTLAELDQLLFSKCEPQPAAPAKRLAKSREKADSLASQQQRRQRISIDDFVKLLL